MKDEVIFEKNTCEICDNKVFISIKQWNGIKYSLTSLSRPLINALFRTLAW